MAFLKGRKNNARARVGGKHIILIRSFLISKPPPPKFSKKVQKQAGKKEGGWGEGIFARLFPAEGGIRVKSGSTCALSTEVTPAKQFLKKIARAH
ncbi:MAG: hypothetical protein AAB893_03155 [Patescibacteria group bacterium]